MPELDRLFVRIEGDTAPLRRSLSTMERTAERSSRRLGTGFARAAGGLDRATRAATNLRTALAGIAAAVVLRQALGEFGRFEAGLIGVGKTADISGEQLANLGRDVQEIARRVPVATTELLSIAQAAGQLGVRGNANIARFTETVAKLGLASDLAGSEAATALARILTVTGTAQEDVDRLGSVIVRLGNNFAATEQEIASVATRVAQATSQFGTSAQDTAGIATALRAVGVQAEAGGSVIGRAFQSINDAVRQGGDQLRALERITGETGDTLRETFFRDSTQAFRLFVDGLGRIQQSGGDVAAALADLDLEGVRVIQVLGTLATRSDVLADTLSQASDEFERNTALNAEALKAAESFTSQMRLVANAVDEAAVAIGRELAPQLVEAGQDFREFVQEAVESGRIAGIARDIAGAFGFLADNIDAVTVAATGFIGVRLGASFGPIGAAVGLLVGLLGGLVTVLSDATDGQSDLNTAVADYNRDMAEANRLADAAAGRQDSFAESARNAAEALREQARARVDNLIAEASALRARGNVNELKRLQDVEEALRRIARVSTDPQVQSAIRNFGVIVRPEITDPTQLPPARRPAPEAPPPPPTPEPRPELGGLIPRRKPEDIAERIQQERELLLLLRQEREEASLRLGFEDEESEELRVQLRLLEIKNRFGEETARNAEEEVRRIERLNTRLQERREAQEALARVTEDELTPAVLRTELAIDRFVTTLTDGFEAAIFEAQSLEEALNDIGRAVSRIGLESFVTGPATNFLSGLFGQVAGGGNPFAATGESVVPDAFRATPPIPGRKPFQAGGMVAGPGGIDNVPARLTSGEFVVNERATRENRELLERINSGAVLRFQEGGLVPRAGAAAVRASDSGGAETQAGAIFNATFNVNVPDGTPDPWAYGRNVGSAAARAFRQGMIANRRNN